MNSLPLIGWIGLGAMGGRMSRNLLRHGYRVLGYEINADRLAQSAREGLEPVQDLSELVRRSDVMITTLPSSESWIEMAEQQLLPLSRAGQVIIDMGTVTPHQTRRLARLFADKQVQLLDAPVSGWITGAENGTLRIWIGGDEPTAQACQPIFSVLGDPGKTTYVGPSGSGQVCKGVNQIKSALESAAYLEAIALGVRGGVPVETIAYSFRDENASDSGFRRALERVVRGEGNHIGVKYRELPYYLDDARQSNERLPMTEALYDAMKGGPFIVTDDNRPAPAYWNALTKQGDPAEVKHG